MTANSTMDFFGHQDAARRASKRLVWLFAAAILGIVAAIYLAAVLLVPGIQPHGSLWNPGLFVVVAAGVALTVLTASAVRTSQLSAGGPAVARMLGGREVDLGTRDERERRLVNVVEEMAIASGVPVPRVFVLDDEDGINAFAAGFSSRDAAVAVTSGALAQFDRDELQGVIAHEFSHVFHGDMRLNTRLIGLLFGIVCIATLGEVMVRSMRHVRSRGNEKNPAVAILLMGLALMLIGSLGAFFAGLIKAAVSRQREFLADASAVTYTRNARGIGKALYRIRGGSGSVKRAGAREASHMFFADGFTHWLGQLGATHPPLEQRIDRVMPGFAAACRQRGGAEQFFDLAESSAAATEPARETAKSGIAAGGLASFAGGTTIAAASVRDMIGHTSKEMLSSTRELLASLPLEVAAAAHSPEEAPALLLSLLVHGGDQRQEPLLAAMDPALVHRARELAAHMRSLPSTAALPLVQLSAPAIRFVPAERRASLQRDLRALAHADGAVTPFELALLHLAGRHAASGSGPAQPPRRVLPATAAVREIGLVLSVMAHKSSDQEGAFRGGVDRLVGLPPMHLLPPEACRAAKLETAMTRLEQLSPLGKKMLVEALTAAAAADGKIATAEGELLRTFAACWDCPLPPMWL
ncbi:MAG: M48 family metallopeptidase [Planctomycetota bacterium]